MAHAGRYIHGMSWSELLPVPLAFGFCVPWQGRQLAGIIVENWLKGRRKGIWVSVSVDLKFDAERDLQVDSIRVLIC